MRRWLTAAGAISGDEVPVTVTEESEKNKVRATSFLEGEERGSLAARGQIVPKRPTNIESRLCKLLLAQV